MLDRCKDELESQLRTRFADCDKADLKAIEPIQAYSAYFKRYSKTYPVQLQLESVALKGKSIPSMAALVEAMFMAEFKNLLLTAGHDLEALQMPITLDVSKGGERYTRLNGQEQMLKSGDMMMADTQGVISSVLYDLDYRRGECSACCARSRGRATESTWHQVSRVADGSLVGEARRSHNDGRA